MKQTWALWEQLNEMDHAASAQGRFDDIINTAPMGGAILGPIMLDPGSLAFELPHKCGYKLIYNNLEDHIEGMSEPSWHQWLNYETQKLDKAAIVEMIQQSVEFTIDQNEKYGFYNSLEAGFKRILLEMDRVIVAEMDRLKTLENPRERNYRVISMRRNLDNFLLTRQLPEQDTS
jgi:hypothetical protein